MRKWNLPLTYIPKIQPVIDGTIRQTIRIVNDGSWKKEVGDLVRFFTWAGQPYHSKRTTITEYTPLKFVFRVDIKKDGLFFCQDPIQPWKKPWDELSYLVALDGIVPPTGEALRDVLMNKNKIPDGGIRAQIIRW